MLYNLLEGVVLGLSEVLNLFTKRTAFVWNSLVERNCRQIFMRHILSAASPVKPAFLRRNAGFGAFQKTAGAERTFQCDVR